MKQLTITLSLIFISFFSYSQEFSFNLIFEDAIGNTDTLTLGYDLNATGGIDFAFGETNIVSNPITSTFDVRFSDVIKNGTNIPTHQSKKQIITNDCPNWLLSDFGTSIEIYSNNYPITVMWDSSQFNDNCRIGTILTDVHPGGWFDTQGTFRTFLEQTDNVVINFPHYDYINSQSQTIGVMWVSFMDTSVFDIPFDPIIFNPPWMSVEEYNSTSLIVFPNPVENHITINYPEKIEKVELYDVQGKSIYSQSNFGTNEIDLSFLNSGIYLLIVETDNGLVIKNKLIKK